METLGICLRLETKAVSQYEGWGFNSMCEFNGQALAAGESGIVTLGGETDGGITAINASIELPTTDLGTSRLKRLRSAFVGYEANGQLKLSVKTDDKEPRDFALKPTGADQRQGSAKVAIGRDGLGRYWTTRVENVNGADFSLDSIELLPVVLNRKPRG